MNIQRLLPTVLLLGACAGASKTTKDGDAMPDEKMEAAGDLKTEEVDYAVGGVKLKGYLAWNPSQSGKRPGVLVVHEWWGHDDYARKRAEQLAGMGYTAFALDMYGDGKKADHPKDAEKFMMEVISHMDVGMERFEAARRVLMSHETVDADKTAAIGYCFGGAVVLHAARAGIPLRGVASFHGNLTTQTPAEPGAIKAAILVAHGDADPFTTPEQLATFKEEMEKAGANLKFVSYPGAKHSFTNPAATERGKQFQIPLEYDEDADQKSWAELDAFLKAIFSD